MSLPIFLSTDQKKESSLGAASVLIFMYFWVSSFLRVRWYWRGKTDSLNPSWVKFWILASFPHQPIVCVGVCACTQLYPTLCNPMDYRPTRLLRPWDSPGQNTGVGSCSLLQGIFPTQESNQGLLHCRRILYQLSYQGSPINLLPLTFQGPWRATCSIQSVWDL